MGCGHSKPSTTLSMKKPTTKKPPPDPILSRERKKNYEPPPDVTGRDDQADADAVMWMRSNDTQTLKKKMKR